MNRVLMPAMLIVTVIASLFYVRSRFLLVEMSYAIGEKRTEKSKLEQDKRELVLELTTLQNPARIEKIAKAQLHLTRLKVPVPQVVVGGGAVQ